MSPVHDPMLRTPVAGHSELHSKCSGRSGAFRHGLEQGLVCKLHDPRSRPRDCSSQRHSPLAQFFPLHLERVQLSPRFLPPQLLWPVSWGENKKQSSTHPRALSILSLPTGSYGSVSRQQELRTKSPVGQAREGLLS